MTGTSVREGGWAGSVRVEDVGVDSVGDDRPIGFEVSIERDRRGMGNGDGRVQLIEAPLEVSLADGVADRAIEISVEGANDGTVGLLRSPVPAVPD